jgi:membrane protein YqaA with SNARE-associated domain
MDLFHKIYNVQAIITWGGMAALVAVVFAETGLLVGFFLPGDSLLVTAGVFCTAANPTGKPLLNILSLIVAVSIAAVVGDQVGFYIGRKAGPKIFSREDSLLFNKKHLIRTHQFYEKHGGKTIIIARFMPIIRTFAPGGGRRGRHELPPLRQLQRFRRHRLGHQHDRHRLWPCHRVAGRDQTHREAYHRDHLPFAPARNDRIPAQPHGPTE